MNLKCAQHWHIGSFWTKPVHMHTCMHAHMHEYTHVLIPFEDGELMGLKVDIARFLTNMLRNVKNHCLLKNCIPLIRLTVLLHFRALLRPRSLGPKPYRNSGLCGICAAEINRFDVTGCCRHPPAPSPQSQHERLVPPRAGPSGKYSDVGCSLSGTAGLQAKRGGPCFQMICTLCYQAVAQLV